MNMNNSTITIVDLPDEMLLTIFNKLNNIDVLYSFVGFNQKLDKIACDINFTRAVDLATITSNKDGSSRPNAILDRFYMHILHRIHENIECLTVQAFSFERVVQSSNYPNLRKFTLINLKLTMAVHIFQEKSPFIQAFKHQISDLIVTINDDTLADSKENLVIDMYARSFALFTNLKHLDVDIHNTYCYSQSLLCDLPPTTCYSSSIIYLRIKVNTFDDCHCLLDGRLSQLHTFIVKVDSICDTSMIINNTESLSKLKCFSLNAYCPTVQYDNQVVPLLRRMSYLEKLTLSLAVRERNSFIDGNDLNNNILNYMPHLHTFIFDIVTELVTMNQQLKPSSDDIRRTFIQGEHYVDCYVDYSSSSQLGRCHVYSLPFTMECIRPITHNFPGGMFMNVRVLRMFDVVGSFEHEFFAKISSAFPLISRLRLFNTTEQKKKQSHQLEKLDETCSVIEYPHLIELNFADVHIDYVEQFLSNLNTRLPCLSKLHVEYEHLVTVTENFTRNVTRTNCEKLQYINFDLGEAMVHSKDFYLYFPLL